MKKYFSQFGDITRLRLSRNKKTGKSKHYGFIEFEDVEVAKVAAETMNNYLIFDHLLKCAVLPKEKVHDELFNGANTKFKPVPWAKISQKRNDSPKSLEQWGRIQKKSKTSLSKMQKKLKEQGIDYDLSNL
ncbi:unnamed protein product [Ambrosiozyma monospora]|uniref:Unnamed protein product n=1 Tax=Ambrosiozyma monospora TaxID=43982 RepID=A0A9W6Z0B1_AMBMO|nr:unnamed protein product [Ambrosiozyma monospora]